MSPRRPRVKVRFRHRVAGLLDPPFRCTAAGPVDPPPSGPVSSGPTGDRPPGALSAPATGGEAPEPMTVDDQLAALPPAARAKAHQLIAEVGPWACALQSIDVRPDPAGVPVTLHFEGSVVAFLAPAGERPA